MTVQRFTHQLADATLPLVRPIVGDIVELSRRAGECDDAYRVRKAAGDASQNELNESRATSRALAVERAGCVAELTGLGVLLEDAARGRVDFPGLLGGEPVLFCWAFGEERVEFFHRVGESFDSRQPLRVPVGAA